MLMYVIFAYFMVFTAYVIMFVCTMLVYIQYLLLHILIFPFVFPLLFFFFCVIFPCSIFFHYFHALYMSYCHIDGLFDLLFGIVYSASICETQCHTARK